MPRNVWEIALVCLCLLVGARAAGSPDAPAFTVTVSGKVTGPSGPVADAWIGVNAVEDWKEATTDASGNYSVVVTTSGRFFFNVRPPRAARLSQINLYREGMTASFRQDFALSSGHLLAVRPTDRDGLLVEGSFGFELQSLVVRLPDNQWYHLEWDPAEKCYQAVLPPDIYYVSVHGAPAGYYDTTVPFDLRLTDQVADIPLRTNWVHPIPYDPPVAAKITIGIPDGLGEATVTGAAGAVLPLAHVLLVNLNSSHQADAISEGDGSFAARLYAPPGSAIMVKHGPASSRWNALPTGVGDGLNPYPGTIIHVPPAHTGDRLSLPFAAVGAVETYFGDPIGNYVGSAWAITGTFGPAFVEGEWTHILTGTYNGDVIPGLYRGGLNWTHPTLADLDADGDLDLLVGEREGGLVLYRNIGSRTAPHWVFEQFNFAGVHTSWWAYPALADVNGDSAPDLFVGAGNGQVLIYYNQGSSDASIWPTIPDLTLNVGSNAAPALADLDADGDLDLVVGQSSGTLHFFRNTGTRTAPAWSLASQAYGGIAEPGVGFADPAFVDLDRDGDLDLLIGRCDLVWYRNDGPATNPRWTRVAEGYGGIGGSCGFSPAASDWDGDGDADLVTGEHWGGLRFYRNDGPHSWHEVTIEFPFELAGDTAPALADLDADGDLDLLVGQAHGQIYQYTNIGARTEPDWRPDGVVLSLPWTNHPHPFPALADIDGDHDQDLFVGEGSWDGPQGGGNIRFYRNDGAPASPHWTLMTESFLGLNVGGWATPVFTDIDADGDLDLFVGSSDGTLTFVENVGTRSAPAWAAPMRSYAGLDLGDYSAPALLDIEGDGDLDLFVGLGNGNVAYVRNDGTPRAPDWKLVTTAYPTIAIGERAIPVAGDLDGDGRADLLLGDGDGGLNYYRCLGPGMPPADPLAFLPGALFQVAGKLRLYSPAIGPTTDTSRVTVGGGVWLQMLFDAAGRPLAPQDRFMSATLTPTGFPIQGATRPVIAAALSSFAVTGLHYAEGHALEADLHVVGRLPVDLPPGIYRPALAFGFQGVPSNRSWLAASVNHSTYTSNEGTLPPITVGDVAPPRFRWQLLMDDFVQGNRGVGAREDAGRLQIASEIVTQGAPYYTPLADPRTGQRITYRLEPFLPTISYTDRGMPAPPLIPFALPGGELHVQVRSPDGQVRDLGTGSMAQSFNRTKTARGGNDLNSGTVQMEDVYSLMTGDRRFWISFDQYGHHVITMTGAIEDLWGNIYTGGGTYDLWVARPLVMDPGILPGTPFQVGDTFNPKLQLQPAVPADIRITVALYPNSDPTQAVTQTVSGRANPYGYFIGSASALRFTKPGEYRVDLTARYTDTDGTLYMGAMTWGGVVETPNTPLLVHGRRGTDGMSGIPDQTWFVACRDVAIAPGAAHYLNPYFNGDILWTRGNNPTNCMGDALIMGASIQDTVGQIEEASRARAARCPPSLTAPGNLEERFTKGEAPLYIGTRSCRPAALVPQDIDQIGYSYRTSQRPGIRVREIVAEDGESGGYWRLATLYDDQLGAGVVGDTTNDYKFQYVGAVYRDLDREVNQYAIQGSLWVFTPPEDMLGARVMPPFAGPGNGGWTTEGGPIMRLKGQDIHVFILPTGVGPGAVLQVGDTFRFAGHIAPTLDSQVAYTVTAPNGAQHLGGGRANKIGYFYDPADDFVIDQPGAWTVDVRVWHDGMCSGGHTVPPYPQGDVLGSERGRYWFYVVPQDAIPLHVQSPVPGFLSFGDAVRPITISGQIPPELREAVVDYSITMPGFILEHGQAQIVGNVYIIMFDPARLNRDFPNLDLIGRDRWWSGLADNLHIGVLLTGRDTAGRAVVQRANVLSIIGEEVAYHKVAAPEPIPTVTPTPTPSATRTPTTTSTTMWTSTLTPTSSRTATRTPTQTSTPQRFPVYLPLLLKKDGGAP